MRRCSPFLRPAGFPPLSPLPICGRFCSRLHRYYAAVRLLTPSPTASSPRLPVVARDRRGDCGRREVSQVPTRSIHPWCGLRPRQGDGSLRNGTAHVAFGSSDSLGPYNFKDFVAQSHTPNDHCVRFAVVVTFPDATLVTRRALPLTWAGLSPAGPRQLRLAHRYTFTGGDLHSLLLAGLPAHALSS